MKYFIKITTKDSIFLLVLSLSKDKALTISNIYKEYKDIFSKIDTIKLSLDKIVYEIKLLNNSITPLYRPLYLCSIKELDYLLYYLEKI